MDLGRIGVWSVGFRSADPSERAEAAAELEELGYGAVWLGGSPSVSDARPMLEATSRIVVATGILSIWGHDAADVAAQQAELPGRFLLGLGASHPHAVKEYRRPYSSMVDYLDALDAAGSPASQRVLAALGPKMLRLSAERCAGAHPYLVTPEHTARARETLGQGPLLAPEVKVVLDTDPDRVRAIARDHLGMYLKMPNYTNNLLRLGYSEDDLRDGGSDRLIDDLFAWGDTDAVRRRIAEHHDAGADHTCLQVLSGDRSTLARTEWRRLAEALDLK